MMRVRNLYAHGHEPTEQEALEALAALSLLARWIDDADVGSRVRDQSVTTDELSCHRAQKPQARDLRLRFNRWLGGEDSNSARGGVRQ